METEIVRRSIMRRLLSFFTAVLFLSSPVKAEGMTGNSSIPESQVSVPIKTTEHVEVESHLGISDYFPVHSNEKEYIYSTSSGTIYRKAEFVTDDVVQISEIGSDDRMVRFIVLGPDYMEFTDTIEPGRIRENLISIRPEGEIILKAPLKVGNVWESGGSVYTISEITGVDRAEIIKVTKSSPEGDTYLYFRPGEGLTRITDTAGNEILTLKLVRDGQGEPLTVKMYFPEGKSADSTMVFHTNDNLKNLLGAAYQKTATDNGFIQVLGGSSSIQYLFFDNGIVYLDMNDGFVEYVSTVSSKENEILQALTNTVCNIFEAEGMSITVNDQRYESGTRKIDRYELLIPRYQ